MILDLIFTESGLACDSKDEYLIVSTVSAEKSLLVSETKVSAFSETSSCAEASIGKRNNIMRMRRIENIP